MWHFVPEWHKEQEGQAVELYNCRMGHLWGERERGREGGRGEKEGKKGREGGEEGKKEVDKRRKKEKISSKANEMVLWSRRLFWEFSSTILSLDSISDRSC